MSGMPTMNVLKGRDMHDMTMDMSVSMATVGLSSGTTSYHSAMPTASGSPEMPKMGSLGPRGCMPPMMFKPGFNLTSLPPETCSNTTSPLLIVSANQTTGWLALNLVNSGAVSALSVSLDGHSMFVYAADGLYVTLQEVKVAMTSLCSGFHPLLTFTRYFTWNWANGIRLWLSWISDLGTTISGSRPIPAATCSRS